VRYLTLATETSFQMLLFSLYFHLSVPTLRHGYENITLSNTNIFYEHAVDFEVLTAVSMKNHIFWEVKSCSLVKFTDVSEKRTASKLRVDE
jgi:hypothetical protein